MLAKAALSLVVVGFLATAFAAPDHIESMPFSQWMRSSKPAGTVQAKTASGEYEKADVKHLCLQEKMQYKCQYVGCPLLNDCTESEMGCPDCTTHYISLSDLECCKPKDYGSEDTPSLMPDIKVGTCDWDMDIYDCYNGEQGGSCKAAMTMDKGTFKIGTAWATCYFNADSEYCGHPLCDRMVLSFQGGVYVAPAYAKGVYFPLTGVEKDESSFVDEETGQHIGCYPINDIINTSPVNNTRTKGRKAQKSAFARAIASTGIPQKMTAKHGAKKSNKKRTGDTSTPTPADPNMYYEGFAVMFSGPVTVTSLDKHVEYNHGMLDYVAVFSAPIESATDKPDTSACFVTPNTYDIMLANKGASYGGDSYPGSDGYKPDGGDGYRPDSPEQYYKGGDGPEQYNKGGDSYKPDGGDGYGKGGERPEYRTGGGGYNKERPDYRAGGGYKGGDRNEYRGADGYGKGGDGYPKGGGDGQEYYKADSYRGQGYPKGASNYQKGSREGYRGAGGRY